MKIHVRNAKKFLVQKIGLFPKGSLVILTSCPKVPLMVVGFSDRKYYVNLETGNVFDIGNLKNDEAEAYSEDDEIILQNDSSIWE